MEFKKHIFKNGLRLILAPMRDTQTATIQILVEAGSKYETKGNNGISHFLEHMMFKGTKNRPTAKKISEELDSFGAEYNAFTDKEQTGYWVKAPKNKFDLALDIAADLYLNPLLKDKDIEVERGVILQELSMYKDLPMRYVWNVFEKLLYGDQPAGWEIIGPKKNIKKFKRADFAKYINNNYHPKTTVVSIAGNFNEKKVIKKIEDLFLPIKNRKTVKKKKTLQSQTKPLISIFNKKTEQTHLMIGVRSCNIFSQDRYATSVLSAILGAGMSSRMFLNIREKYGLTYYIGAASEQTTDTGYLFANAGVEHKNLEKTVQLIINEFKKIKNKKVSIKELKKAVEYLKGRLLMNLESSDEVASFFGNQELFRKEIKQPKELFEKLEKITENDIIKIADKIFVNKGLNLAVIGPHNSKSDLEKILKF